MTQGKRVLIAQLENTGALARLVRAALLHEIADVPLAEAPRGGGAHTLQLRVGTSAGISVAAEPVGTRVESGFPMRLRPLDPSHIAELNAILGDGAPPSGPAPLSASASAIFDEHPPLPPMREAMGSETLPDAREIDPPSSNEDDLGASVLFDPEAALISRAPARPPGTAADDTLTVPLRASTFPVGPDVEPPQPLPASRGPSRAPPPRPPSAPAPAATKTATGATGVTALSNTVPLQSAPSARLAPPAIVNELRPRTTSEISISVDLDTSTQRIGADSEAEVPDPSIGESVVIDPDVLAREQRTSGSETAAAATLRRPSTRRDPRVEDDDDDDATLMRDSARPVTRPAGDIPMESRAMTSSLRVPRTPRTMKKTQLDVVAGRTIANKYRIQSLVGSGAVGAVYKAAHTELERTVAIKVLHDHWRTDPHLMQQFRAEARAASLLHHPNVTVVHDFGVEPDGLVYIVMEYLQGWALQTVLDEEQRLPPPRALRIMLQVCAALATAHECGIVHRDVKPDNIMLIPSRDDDGKPLEVVKVCDFGIAALESAPMDEDGYTAGTPEYMAPEQAGGRSDARTDVYACGILLYEMVTGNPPFVADTPIATLKKHALDPPRPPSELVPELPQPLEAAILRALEKAPERRWQSMRELRSELKRILG